MTVHTGNKGRIAVEGISAAGIQHRFGEFPKLAAELVELIARDVEQLTVKHARLEIFLFESSLKGFV